MKVLIDLEKCTGCEKCFEICPADPNVFEIKDKKSYVVNIEACLECGACESECPEEAIKLED